MQTVDFDLIRETVTCEQLLDRVGIRVRNGMTVCPLHPDHDDSMKVFGKQGYYCFGCHQGGDVISLMAKLENKGYTEAAKDICLYFGISGTKRIDPEAVRKRRQQEQDRKDIKRMMTEIHSTLCALYRQERMMASLQTPYSDEFKVACDNIPILENMLDIIEGR